MTIQLVTRVPEDVASSVDALVTDGVFASRSEVVRKALDLLIERERRAAIGRAILAGYERLPQEADDLSWTAVRGAMIAQEPW